MRKALLAGFVLLAGTAAAGAQGFYDDGPRYGGPPPYGFGHRPPPPDDFDDGPRFHRPPPPDDYDGPPRFRRPPPRMVCVVPPPPWRHRPAVCPTRPGPPGSPCGCPGLPYEGHRDFARF